jgi:pantoate--beta-alanine ligase
MMPVNWLVQQTLKYTYFRRIIQLNRRFILIHMVVIHGKRELDDFLQPHRLKGINVGFVPTMGALHAGHASLLRQARTESKLVVLSIFVNPTQFNDSSDYSNYPSTIEPDLELARSEGVDVVFLPEVKNIYGDSAHAETSDYGSLTRVFEGEKRTGHFDGVVTVVRRLFNIVQPQMAFFGEKDLQQLAVIRHLARLEFPSIRIVGCPLIRDADGLALSSRNVRIPKEGRVHALKLHEALLNVAQAADTQNSIGSAVEANRKALSENEHIQLEYFDAVNGESFEVLKGNEVPKGAFAIVAAVVSGVRLIDNCRL